MKTAKFQYKCRLCGEIFDGSCTSEELALMVLVSTIRGYDMPSGIIGQEPKMTELHSGCKKGCGVADLIGYIVEED